MNSRGGRLGLCEVCNGNAAKYTCPKCELKTCCLACIKIHKQELKCDGERDKTSYKPLSKFSNLDLLSDYRMLEETTRSVERYRSDPLGKRKFLHKRIYKLKMAVAERGTTLLCLPRGFSRCRSNRTYYDYQKKHILWTVEWIFPQADNIQCIDERVSEDSRLSTLISKYLDPDQCPDLLKERLQFYQSVGLSQMSILLKAECVRKSGSRFYLLDPAKTLKAVLKKRAIVEFPTLYVVHNAHKDIFDIVDSDEEVEVKEKDEVHLKGAVKIVTKKKNNNYLFHHNSDTCDSDDNEKSSKEKHHTSKDIKQT